MDIMHLIKTRRSIRTFTAKPVPEGIINKVIEAGSWAPSANNRQPWRFIAITDSQLIARMSSAILKKVYNDPLVIERMKTKKDPIFYSAPLLIIILKESGNNTNPTVFNKWADIDCALAAQNMMLYAHSIGIGSCMVGRIKRINLEDFVKVADGYDAHSSIVFGYPAEKPGPKPRRDGIVERIG